MIGSLLLRWIAKTADLLQRLLILAAITLLVLAHPQTLRLVAQKFLGDLHYRKIEGSLLGPITITNLTDHKAFHIKQLTLSYSLSNLLQPTPTFRSLILQSPILRTNHLRHSNQQQRQPLPIPLSLEHLKIIDGHIDSIAIDTQLDNLHLQHAALSIETINAKAILPQGRLTLRGAYHQSVLHAQGLLHPTKAITQKLQKRLNHPPTSIAFSLTYHDKRLTLHANLPKIIPKKSPLIVRNIATHLTYFTNKGYGQGELSYTLHTPYAEANATQSLLITPSLAFATTLQADLSSRYPLPAPHLTLQAAGNREALTATLRWGPYRALLRSNDYQIYLLSLKSHSHSLDYLRPLISPHNTKASLSSQLRFAPSQGNQLDGNITLKHTCATLAFQIESNTTQLLLNGQIQPDWHTPLCATALAPVFRHPFWFTLYHAPDRSLASFTSDPASATLFKDRQNLYGWANLDTLQWQAKGNIDPNNHVYLHLKSKVDSLYALLKSWNVTPSTYIDAQIDAHMELSLKEHINTQFTLSIPWYVIQHEPSNYYGLNSSIQGTLTPRHLRIDRYDIGFLANRFHADRPSIVKLDTNQTLTIKQLSLLDHATLFGHYDLQKHRGRLHLRANHAHLRQPEINATFDAALDATLQQASYAIEGEINVTKATISYMPPRSTPIQDEDIIIIQHLKKSRPDPLNLYIHLQSHTPLLYHTTLLQAKWQPDLTLYKEPSGPIVLLGIVHIPEGTLHFQQKHLQIEPSEIYFAGSHPINPYLDLALHYQHDLKHFYIHLEHTLSDPLIRFRSKPPMRKNDIISYLLFNAPANDLFKSKEHNIAAALLGVGLKEAIGAATGMQFDTLGIMRDSGGNMGVQIGKQFGQLRLLYHASSLSTLYLQYRLSSALQIDLKIDPSGEEVQLFYTKDFQIH